MNLWTKVLSGALLATFVALLGSAQAQVTYNLGGSVDMLDPSFYAGQPEDGSNVDGRQAFFAHTSHDGKQIAFWAVNSANFQSSFFVVDVGAPASYRRITTDFGYSPSAPIYWTPDDSAIIVGPFRIAIPPVGQISGLTPLTIHGLAPNDTSVTSLASGNWAMSLLHTPGVTNIAALPILGDGSEDLSRQPVVLTDFTDATLSPDWPCVSPDGTLITFADYHGTPGDSVDPDVSNVYVLKNVPAILSAPPREGTNISSLAPVDANDSNVVAIRADESPNFAHIPTFSQDKSLVFYSEDFNNVFANTRFFATFALGDFDILISNADGSGADFRLQQAGNQAFPSTTPGGIRIVYVSSVGDAMHLFISTIEVVTAVTGTALPNNDILTTATQETQDGSGTVVNIPPATTINFPDGAPQEIQVVTPVDPVTEVQLPPDIAAIPVLRDFGPDGTQFDPAITVTITYTDAEVEGLDENTLRVFRFNPGSGIYDDEVTTGIVRDTANNRISFSVDHFSTYGLGASTDTDNDGIIDSSDPDDDNDGVADGVDAMPLDTDNDGVDNDVDADDDSDGLSDFDDAQPLDTDNDGIGNDTDADDDNDGIADSIDVFFFDTDNDGQNNAVDLDDDSDGISDTVDAMPLDTDNDGQNNAVDLDDDGDGVSDQMETGMGTDPLDAGSVPQLPLVAWPVFVGVLAVGLYALRPKKRMAE